MLDLVIVGAGPAALSAAIYAARDGFSVRIYERAAIGGIITTTDMVENYPGFPEGISGYEISKKMREQAEKFGAKIQYGTVSGIEKTASGDFELLVDNEKVLTKAVLLATGNDYRKLGLENEDEFTGRGIHFCATCDGPFYMGKEIIAVGGGDTAIEESLFLSKFSKVKLLVRSQLRAQQILQDRLSKAVEEGKIEVFLNTQIKEFLVEDNKIAGVLAVRDGEDFEIRDTPAIFEFIGLIPNTGFLKPTGIELSTNGEIKVDNFMTNIEGIFAAGDVVENSEKQLVIAAGSGANAALEIRRYLNSK
ncbi:thioredoxin reductase [Candidatus Saccharibacteria bacterium]|jgi:thioredoxin reductase (NADPH)|nr:thioredoxin reductase [Candidatus Saccharibacteria bacterium]